MNIFYSNNKYQHLIYRIIIYIFIINCVYNQVIKGQDDLTSGVKSQSSKSIFCSQLVNCSACISSPKCAWCILQTPFINRCDLSDNLLANGCPDSDIINPASSVKIVKDGIQVNSLQSQIQLHPQKIHLHIRQNDLQKFKIKYEQKVDYPVDLYYLMGLTYSMKRHKEKLVEVADQLAHQMNNITKSFRLGFGSFIDKVVMPFTNMLPAKLQNSCTDRQQCISPYGFRNHLPLNHNISQFAVEVGSTPLSGNLDNAEGGFDAIMQVIVCRQHIDWHTLSRKIILFATDSTFHYAGDGKLGGIVRPNDGKCHLSEDGLYTESIAQDYPSLEQIHRAVTESKTNIIFAVPEDSIGVYKQLSSHIPGSTTGVLRDDSSNIVDIIRDNFHKITSKVEIRDNSSQAVEVRYMSKCLATSKSETNTCHNIGNGQAVEFDVEIKVTKCPPGGRETFVITPIGVDEYTVVELHVMCDCECERQPVAKPNSTECSSEGTYACGVCECHPNRFGKRCECDGNHVDHGNHPYREDMFNQCKRDSNSTIICSNRGNCVCGECQCHSRLNPQEVISGKFCECDTFSCDRDINGQTCGGQQRGYCCDGSCHCVTGWSGSICDCNTSNTTCIYDEASNKLCSGRGDCRCGTCYCDDGYYGQHCEEHSSSCEGRCNDLQPCVECKAFNSGIYSDDECRDKCTFDYQITASLESQEGARRCICFDIDDCAINFSYEYYDNKLFVWVAENRECPAAVDTPVSIIVGLVFGSIFLFGLIVLLVVRLVIRYKDKLECERLEAEMLKSRNARQKPGTEMNKIYKSPTITHQNPMYGKSSKDTSM